MATLTLKQIERANVTFTTTDETKTLNLSTTLTDTTKTILLFTAKSGSDAPEDYHVLGRILSTTQIQFERTAGPTTDCIVEYQVIEFTQGITVQHKYFTQSAATTDTAITAVTLSKAFPILSMNQSGSTYGANDIMTADLTSTTNLRTITGSYTSCPVAVQVIELDDATVTRYAGSYGTGATADISLSPSITESTTFWVFTLSTGSGFFFENNPTLSFVNTSTLRFTRSDTTGINFSYIVFVINVSAGITVQNSTATIASGTASISPTISSVTVANTALLLNGMHQRFGYLADTAGDDAGGAMIALSMSGTTATSYTAARTDSPALACTANVQVLTFSPASTEQTQVTLIYDFY